MTETIVIGLLQNDTLTYVTNEVGSVLIIIS